MGFAAQEIKSAQKHLRAIDPTMKVILKRVGPFTLKPTRDRFTTLVRSILSQQISTAAARTVRERLEQAVGSQTFRPQQLADFDTDRFRELGISRQKASYLLDLRDQTLTGSVRLDLLGKRDDEQVIEELIQIKGIGRWTAQMFLIFCLGRLDVFPYDDLGIRNAMTQQYGFDESPSREEADDIAKPWRPFRTVASWYLWRSLEWDDEAGE